MNNIRVISKNISQNNPEFIYISLDTIEGSSCVGHWLWECALFLPYIVQLQKDCKIPFKILLHEKKIYKSNILSDFGFHECDILYSTNMVKDPDGTGVWQEKVVYPDENSEYILFLPTFMYLWQTKFDNKSLIKLFFSSLNQFRMHYINNIQNIEKTIPITYVARSKVENYKNNSRNFINVDAFCNLLDNNMVNILYTDTLQSFNPQFNTIIKSKVLIVEMGSAFTINAAFIAMDSHIIVINDFYDYYTADENFFHIFRFLMQDRNNTVEIFSTGSYRDDFSVDIDAFKRRIDELLTK